MTDYWFFVSHARADKPFPTQFFNDLTDEVRRRGGPAQGGFFDEQSIETGEEWQTRMQDALQGSRVLVTLQSPQCFNSAYCGWEWSIFRERQNQFVAKTPSVTRRPPIIVPIQWIPVALDEMPHEPKEVQFSDPGFPAEYAEKGLEYLLRLSRDAYTKVVIQLAVRIVSLAKEHQLPPLDDFPPYSQISNPFRPSPLVAGGSGGPRRVRFVFAVAKQVEMAALRADGLEAYGDESDQWKPYFPARDEVGLLAQNVATAEKLMFEMVELDEKLPDRVTETEAKNNILLLVVDPWTAQLKDYQKVLGVYDTHLSRNSTVVIPWNMADGELQKAQSSVEAALKTVFSHSDLGDTRYFRHRISSLRQLQTELGRILYTIKMRIINEDGAAVRTAGAPTQKPTISA